MTPSPAWRAGVIAAGWGERLRRPGAPAKALVDVGGVTLIERVLTSIAELRPHEVVVIVNAESTVVREHVSRRAWPFALRWLIETTPSSMHSFLRVVETLAADGDAGPFFVSTVDTVAMPGAYAQFAAAAAASAADVILAATSGWDDEKPLLIRMEDGGRVREINVAGGHGPGVLATAGYYCVRPSILREAASARADGLTALRLFLGRLLAHGYEIAAVEVPPAIDVDRPADVSAAEAFLKQVRA